MVHIIYHADDAIATSFYFGSAENKESAVAQVKNILEGDEPMTDDEFFDEFAEGDKSAHCFGDNGWFYEIIDEMPK